jgi:head-tail adaptor
MTAGTPAYLLSAGQRNRKIEIEQSTVTLDDHGGEAETWSLLAIEHAQVSHGGGQERREAAQERASVPATFRVLNNSRTRQVRPKGFRIVYQDVLWDVTSAVPLGRSGFEITAMTSYEPYPYGPNLIENGTFDADDTTGWTLVRCSVSGGKLQMVQSTGFIGQAVYTVPAGVEEGATYRLEWDFADVVAAGGVSRSLSLGGLPASYPTGEIVAGHFSKEIVAGGANESLLIGNRTDDNYTIDNIILRKVL